MESPTFFKSKIFKGLAVFALLVAGLWLYLSLTWEERTLKFALKVDEIPSSVRVLYLQEDAWGGYGVHGRFEIAPEDLPAILKGRPFTLTTFSPGQVLPRDGRVINHWYRITEPGLTLTLGVDEKKEFVELIYGAD
jgi:hypothetical protein